MAKFGVKQKTSNEPTWQTFHDEGDGDPIRFLVMDWTLTSANEINRLTRDRDHIKSLGLTWDENFKETLEDGTEAVKPRWLVDGKALPYGNGDRKDQLRNFVMYNYMLRGWSDNVVQEDGVTPLEVCLFNKAWLNERGDLALWLLQRGGEGGAKLVVKEAKN